MRALSKKEKILLIVLGVAVAFCLFILFLVVKMPEINEVQSSINVLEESIRSIKSLEVNEKDLTEYFGVLKTGITAEKERYHAVEDQDMTQLSLEILDIVKKHGLTYTRLNKVDSESGSYIEIAMNGALPNIVSFLQEIYERPKYLNIYFLTLNNTSRTANATIRMNYGEITDVSH